MVEVDKIYESKVKFTGVFDFKVVYGFVYHWLMDNRYFLTQEKNYTEKIKPEGKEIEVDWDSKKKISDYFRFYLKIHWFVPFLNAVEVEREGVKVKMNKGQVEVKITAYLEKDYEHRWETTSISKFLRGLYDSYIIRNRIESYEEKIIEEVDELVAQIKAFLELEGKKSR